MIAGVAGKRSQIAGLISSDLAAKREEKKRTTAADLLKAKMGIGGRRDVAQIQQTGAMARERVGQTGATFRKSMAVAADKYIQGMRGKQALGVQALRNVGATGVQELRGEQASELLEEQAQVSKYAAEEEDYRTERQTSRALATIPTIDAGEYTYIPEEKKKKKEESEYLTIPGA